jgi:methylated-DNA-[protein]-cysteine S-methyltransferase
MEDFSDIELDLEESPPFARQVYKAARKIPLGQTRTYGQIAKSAGSPGAARAVGHALGQNPIALIVPCHRVLAAGGKKGGFSAHGGCATKARMLEIEGADVTMFA